MGYRERLGFKSAMFGALTIRAGFQEKKLEEREQVGLYAIHSKDVVRVTVVRGFLASNRRMIPLQDTRTAT